MARSKCLLWPTPQARGALQIPVMADTAGPWHDLVAWYGRHRRPVAHSYWLLWPTPQATSPRKRVTGAKGPGAGKSADAPPKKTAKSSCRSPATFQAAVLAAAAAVVEAVVTMAAAPAAPAAAAVVTMAAAVASTAPATRLYWI